MSEVHGPTLFRFAHALSKQDSDACDLVQDAYERALRSCPPSIDDEGLGRWLTTVVRNRHIDCRRSMARMATDVDVSRLPAEGAEDLPLWKHIDPRLVSGLIEMLPPHSRETLRLALEGHRGEEIARRLAIKPGTVVSRTYRARRQLRGLLEQVVPALVPARDPMGPVERNGESNRAASRRARSGRQQQRPAALPTHLGTALQRNGNVT
jgi:RNA polymerase sigma-70 factor (ECF subfamily)